MKASEKYKIRKRFFVTILGFVSISIIPIVYMNYGIEASITTVVVTGIITLVSIYIAGQSASDTIGEWKDNNI